jgi:hypothetical protein
MFCKFLAGSTNPADLDRMVEQFKRGMETPVQSEPGAESGEQLKAACKALVNTRHRGRFVSSGYKDDPESFGSKLKAAVQRRIGQRRVTRHA